MEIVARVFRVYSPIILCITAYDSILAPESEGVLTLERCILYIDKKSFDKN